MKILKRLSKGTKLYKLIKLGRLFKHTAYWIFGKAIGQYPAPPKDIKDDIGFFDKKRLIHTSDKYKHFFKEEILYEGGDYRKMHPELISLSFYEDKVLIKKWYEGINKYNKFYNELICLNSLSKTYIVPKVYFVDYTKYCIYMEYISGDVLSNLRRNKNKVVYPVRLDLMKEGFLKAIHKMHRNGIVLNDMRDDNMVKKELEFYFIDFADAVYESITIKIFFNKMKEKEKVKMVSVIERCVEVYNNKNTFNKQKKYNSIIN